MKIGILTHHYVKNYGAFLQMKAMYETLKRIYPEAQVCVVNYVVGKHWLKNILHVLHYRLGLDTPKTYFRKIRQLCLFTKYERSLPRTKSVHSAEEINGLGLDLLILGSDEIWNFNGSGYSPLKFGYGLDTIELIAYAPSVGSVTEENDIPKEAAEGLANICRISGRDIETVRFVKRAVDREADKMLDPTFLYDFDPDIESEGVEPESYKYILVYDCKLTEEMSKELRRYADENGYKILGAGDYKLLYDKVTVDLTPYEWVALFRHAERIVTGTFHGTVFSVKYDKPVVCYPTEKNRINKISSLLDDMGLAENLVKVGDEGKFIDVLKVRPSFTRAHQYIEEMQQRAGQFLRVK